jgi:mRNA interferase YafQ
MKPVRFASAFRKDFRRVTRRGYNAEHLKTVVSALRADIPLPASARPHPLKGEWKGYWECHIESDWLLIYKITDEVLLARTGSHADLFE